MTIGRTFAFLWASTGLSNVADGVLKVGAPLLAVSVTRSPLLVSLTAVAGGLPWLLCTLHAGVMADRRDRRRVMVAAHWARAGVFAVVAVLGVLGQLTFPVLLVALLVAGVGEVFADTSAQSVLPMTVPPERVAAANGRIVGAQTVGNDFLGGPAAGLLVGVSAAVLFAAPAVVYAAAAVLLLGMHGRFRPERVSTRPLRADMVEGLRYLRGHRVLRSVAASAGLLNLANAAYWAVFVLFAVGPWTSLALTPAAYGLLMTAVAVGILAGSLVAHRVIAELGDKWALLLSWLVNSLLLLVPVLAPHLVPTYTAAVLLGVTNALANVVTISLRHRLVPEDLLGRVNSVYRLIGMSGIPVGAALGGLLATMTSLPVVLITAVGVCLAGMVPVVRAGLPRPAVANLTVKHSGVGGWGRAGLGVVRRGLWPGGRGGGMPLRRGRVGRG
ncbi:MFS family permease [Sphaerisporangium rubeum]|uniref:MFS family permease n=1 Tax=Sphaerisporangium rubeum TaxID=321317 RepID=A0A7X0M7P5_9ACTN|nr:MFS family permease [Sphaerisporangium rubeum]